MENTSDFEKELELEVVDPTDPKGQLTQEILQGKQPSRIRDIVSPKKAYNFDTGVPNQVDTLREEEKCPWGMGNDDCGLIDGSCSTCGYSEPVEGLQDPDISKAKEVNELQEKNDDKESPSKMNRPRRPSFAKKDVDPGRFQVTFSGTTAPLEVIAKDISSAIMVAMSESRDRGFITSVRRVSKAKSKHQFRLMKGICEGNITDPDIPKDVACEFVKNHQSPKGLPEKVKKNASKQDLQFLYELVQGGFDDLARQYIEKHEGSGDPDILNAKFVLETQGPTGLVDWIFKEDPQAAGMVDSLYEDDSPEDSPNPLETQERRQRYERNYQDYNRKQPHLPGWRATPDNWIPGR